METTIHKKKINLKKKLKTWFDILKSSSINELYAVKNFIERQSNSQEPLRFRSNVCHNNITDSNVTKNNVRAIKSTPMMISDSSSNESESSSFDEDFVNRVQPKNSTELLKKDMSTALDRAKLSDRKAALIIKTSGHNMSYSTVRRARISTRSEKAREIKENFISTKPLIVHWDGKLMPDNAGTYF